ncbi:WYL domain-containing protein, partial [Actinomadura viridis]|uniref:WYL domain-containing protein n=1 Tax=Actinomadura viridis TaxID=58110 RepID=UPI0031F00919
LAGGLFAALVAAVVEVYDNGQDGDALAAVDEPLLRAALELRSPSLDRAIVESSGGITTATLQVADEHSLKRLAARRGGAVEILSPPAARAAAAAWAEAGLAQYH